ncbi:MAG: glycosyltransferase family 9 protein [Candidatus Omnitrophica bacterium]|nr:glycosyltransferase family 9 protein [Candidatus Omnitrophota bacterium]MBU0880566.1 glycosyltransferase family 9 protein [Candidatus Omnitrophota bacterium]
MELKDVKKILIINLGGIGDILLSLVSVRALRGAYKGATIDILVVDHVGEFAGTSGLFDDIFLYKTCIPKNLSLFMGLGQNRYDLVVNMRTMVSALGALKMSVLLKIINGKIWAGRDTNGYGGFFDIKIPETRAGDKYEMEYDIELVEKLGARVDDRSVSFRVGPGCASVVDGLLKEANISSGDIIVGIHPGGKPSRRWPLENFAEVMRRINGAAGCAFVITGDEEDASLAGKLTGMPGVRAINMAGRLSLEELGALMKRCRLFISNDTAAMHIAAALKVPLVAIFGPGNLKRFDPRNIMKEAIVIFKETACAPCERKACRRMECLKTISPDVVASAALKLLKVT